MTLLLIDAGNSRCKWAWIENRLWLRHGVFDHADANAWKDLQRDFELLDAPEKILISNVAGSVIAQKLVDLCEVLGGNVQFVAAKDRQCGVSNFYEQPAQLGSDRWAALIAAWHQVQSACLVVNCGTATTVDTLSANGEFLGGVILPGISLMQRSLLNSTALLGNGNGDVCDYPRNTYDAVASGVIRATVGVIDYQYALLGKNNNLSCIISGGAANELVDYLNMKYQYLDNLVLRGMQIMEENCQISMDNETVAR